MKRAIVLMDESFESFTQMVRLKKKKLNHSHRFIHKWNVIVFVNESSTSCTQSVSSTTLIHSQIEQVIDIVGESFQLVTQLFI